MIEDSYINKKTKSVIITITSEMLRKYCELIGESKPIYLDLTAAKQAGYEDLLIPSTYPTLFWQYIDIPWLANRSNLILRDQSFEYNKPLTANKKYRCYIELKRIRSHDNKQLLKHRLYIWNENNLVATSDTTLVLSKE